MIVLVFMGSRAETLLIGSEGCTLFFHVVVVQPNCLQYYSHTFTLHTSYQTQ